MKLFDGGATLIALMALGTAFAGWGLVKPKTVTITQQLQGGATVSCQVKASEVTEQSKCVGE